MATLLTRTEVDALIAELKKTRALMTDDSQGMCEKCHSLYVIGGVHRDGICYCDFESDRSFD